MIILDTNILSALMRHEPDMKVVDWLDSQPAESVWITAITVYEIDYGLHLLPDGKRRQRLQNLAAQMFAEQFQRRILAFDRLAAAQAARLAAQRHHAGLNIDTRDTMIAGIALGHRARLATRNARHFADLDLDVIDPWENRK